MKQACLHRQVGYDRLASGNAREPFFILSLRPRCSRTAGLAIPLSAGTNRVIASSLALLAPRNDMKGKGARNDESLKFINDTYNLVG